MTDFDRFPRVPLAHLPTPLEPLPRLGDALGVELWVKRDDATGLGLGGNKVRKLEFLLGRARADRATTVITLGGVQSNHARQTAAAAARLGLRCQLVLPRVVPLAGAEYEGGGNVLLDRMLGAEVHIEADEAAAARRVRALLDAAEERGESAVVLPPGGSTGVGSLGYAAAVAELVAQRGPGAPELAAVYAAASTGGTLAGLCCGASLCGVELPVRAICVAGSTSDCRAATERLAGECAELLERPPPSLDAVRFRGDFLGAGYGLPDDATLEALQLAARLEGLVLDPVYTGKAMAALIADARAGRLHGPVLFWHTGGAPGLFAYREVLGGIGRSQPLS